MATIERKAEFFRITAKGGDNGLFGDKLLGIMDQVAVGDREFEHHGTSVNLIAEKTVDGLIAGTIKQMRSTAPSKRKMGQIESTKIELEQDEGIDEATHFVYCPETSNICIEYNYHGPKLTLLLSVVNHVYAKRIDKDVLRSAFVYMKDGSGTKRVKESYEVRSVTAEPIDPLSAGKAREDADLPEVFRSFKPPQNSRMLIRVMSKVKGGHALSVKEFIRLFLPKDEDLEYYEKLKVGVADETGKTKEYDLIKDRLFKKFRVPLMDGSAQIDSEAILAKLQELLVQIKKDYTIAK